MNRQIAYSYRSFEHFKRETYPIILAIAGRIDGGIRVLDLGCGPAVLDAMLLTELGPKIESIDMLDISAAFLATAKQYLSTFDAKLRFHSVDFNNPASFPKVGEVNLIVSTNALFHTRGEQLAAVYGWCFGVASRGAIFVNHQTMGHEDPGFAAVLQMYGMCLDNRAVLDVLDKELTRRSQLDSAGSSDEGEPGGGYAGLQVPVSEHLALLRNAGFCAGEIWRKGSSAMVLAAKP